MKRMHNLVNSTQWDEISGRWLELATTRSVQKSDLVGLLATAARNRMGNLLDVSTFMMCEIPAFLLDVRLSISSMVKLYMLHPNILVRNNWWRCSSLWANPRPFVYRPSAAPLSHFECCSAHRRLWRSHHFWCAYNASWSDEYSCMSDVYVLKRAVVRFTPERWWVFYVIQNIAAQRILCTSSIGETLEVGIKRINEFMSIVSD